MTLSKIIVECFVENLTLEELREFKARVLIPQRASGLIEHAEAAERIIIQGGIQLVKTKNKHKEKEPIAT